MIIEYEKYRLNKEYRDKLVSEYKKGFAISQKLEKINSEFEEIFENVKENCNASNDETSSKKDELIDILEEFCQQKWVTK